MALLILDGIVAATATQQYLGTPAWSTATQDRAREELGGCVVNRPYTEGVRCRAGVITDGNFSVLGRMFMARTREGG